MAYDIVSLPDSVIWIRYSGLVNFAERMQALEAVAVTTTPMAQMRLLIDSPEPSWRRKRSQHGSISLRRWSACRYMPALA